MRVGLLRVTSLGRRTRGREGIVAYSLHGGFMHLDLEHLKPVGSGDTDAWRDPLGLMLASTGEGFFGVDLEGLCVFINPAGARMIGFEPHQVLGQNMHDLTHYSHGDGAHYPMDDCPIYNAFRQGQPCRIDSEVFWRQDGSHFPVEYSSYPVFDQGQVRGAVVTFVDITARKRAEDALHQAKNDLEARVAERTHALETALQQLRELAAWSETVREEERTRIAREVHDELGSLLVALKMDVGWLDKRLSEQEQRAAVEAQSMVDFYNLYGTGSDELLAAIAQFALIDSLVLDW